jgi:hypothetical protein
MTAIAPNLTVLVGELVGARLIAHAGSLISLAKQPASTVQILGAEKALFRCVRTCGAHMRPPPLEEEVFLLSVLSIRIVRLWCGGWNWSRLK